MTDVQAAGSFAFAGQWLLRIVFLPLYLLKAVVLLLPFNSRRRDTSTAKCFESQGGFLGSQLMLRWFPDLELIIRRIIEFYEESILLLYHALVYNLIVWIIRIFKLDNKLRKLESWIRSWLTKQLGEYRTATGETVEFSLYGFCQPDFNAPKEYNPKAFPFKNPAYGQQLDHPANVHFSVNSARLGFEEHRLIKDVINNRWGCHFIESKLAYFQQRDANSFCAFVPNTSWYSFRTDSALVIVFRGTDALSLINWESDFDARMIRVEGMGGVHGGFYSALFSRPKDSKVCVYEDIIQVVRGQENELPVYVTGLSLGAALAAVFSQALVVKDSDIAKRVDGIFTFGEPRVGDDEFVDNFFTFYGAKCMRYVYGSDIVPRVPPRFGYAHHPVERYMTSFFVAKQRVLKGETSEEEILGWKTFESHWVLPLSLVKLWVSPWGETRLRTVIRLVLLPLPGVNDHLDYELVIKRYMVTYLRDE